MKRQIRILADTYQDSVRLLEATRTMMSIEGVAWAWAAMATPANLDTLADEGFTGGLEAVRANDLLLAARGVGDGPVEAALAAADDTLFGSPPAAGPAESQPIHDLADALVLAPETNVAIVSVPGPFAALEAHKALSHGLHVLLFSDNVPLADEVALKRRARELGLLVMGPGAGTAVLADTGLGFANRGRPGPVGVVAAAGTGAQEVHSLLDRWGVGASNVIGVGGRDLSAAVGGLMAEAALDALDRHPGTEAILLVSKPPSPEVATHLLGTPASKPRVACLIGLEEDIPVADGTIVCNTLEQGAAEVMAALGRHVPDRLGSAPDAVATHVAGLAADRSRLVGLFSGGTLCYEAMTIAMRHIGPIHSNTPLDPSWALPAPPSAHVALDLGEEEYTEGRPHPMIDPEARVDLLLDQVDDPTIAAVLMDVVLGDGSHANPASLIAPAAEKVVQSGAPVITYVLGTELDPQGLAAQQSALRDAGCIVTETAARSALAAAAMVNRDPTLVHTGL